MPKRPRSHQLEDIALTKLSSIFIKSGWTAEPVQKDYGEDIIVRIFIRGKATSWFFFVQSKATDSIERLLIKNGRYLSMTLNTENVLLWSEFTEPVVLTLFDAKNEIFYWETVQRAVNIAKLRGKRYAGRTTKIWIPVKNVLNKNGLERIKIQTKSNFDRLEREKVGIKCLTDGLKEHLGIDIVFDAQYGIISIPSGSFVPNKDEGPNMIYFGRAKRDLEILGKLLGTSPGKASEIACQNLLDAWQKILRGEPAVFTGPDGRILDIWFTKNDGVENFYRTFEESDED